MLIDQQASSWLHDYGAACVAFLGFLLNGLLIYGSNRERKGEYAAQFAALAHWKEKHEEESDQRDKGIAELQKIAASSTATALAMKESLEFIQQELRDNRNREQVIVKTETTRTLPRPRRR